MQALEDRRFTVEHFAFAVRQGDGDWLGWLNLMLREAKAIGRVPRARRALQPLVPVRAVRRGALSRWSVLVERVSDRLGKSSRVFLIGLLVACGIEVAVDWNSTLYEVNVLRSSLKQKGEDYVDILRRAAQPAVEAYDWDALDELSRGLFDDEDVVYVRFSDALGNTLHDRVRADFAAAYHKTHRHRRFARYYRHQMERDAGGMMTDPLKLRERIAGSRHRDLIQAFTDGGERPVGALLRAAAGARAAADRALSGSPVRRQPRRSIAGCPTRSASSPPSAAIRPAWRWSPSATIG